MINDQFTPNFFGDNEINNQRNLLNQDSGFKAWQADSLVVDSNPNMLRNFKSQLIHYQQKYQKQHHLTIPIKLPCLQKRSKNSIKEPIYVKKQITQSKSVMTERKKKRKVTLTQNICQHKSIDLQRVSSKVLKNHQKSNIIQLNNREEKFQSIAKVHEMKFEEKQARIRKRDIYLSLFGEKSKYKVQRITFDEENTPYQQYLQRRNKQMKIIQEKKQPLKPKTSNQCSKKAGGMRY